MSLHVDSYGSGAPLVMLHGWGMHGGIWDEVVPQLARQFRVHCMDLPGYGYSKLFSSVNGRGWADAYPLPQPLSHKRERGVEMLNEIIEQLVAQFDEPLLLCGWSLGGQVAMRWGQLFPAQVRKLVLVASTPCFVERKDWRFGMAAETLQQFEGELERDHAATLRRFLALQLRGSENERELLQRLRERLFSRGEPDPAALREGLEILRDTDLRRELASIGQPTLVIAGERDKLTPPEASCYLAQTMPNARLVNIKGAAHAPFLSHPQVFVEQIMDFLHE